MSGGVFGMNNTVPFINIAQVEYILLFEMKRRAKILANTMRSGSTPPKKTLMSNFLPTDMEQGSFNEVTANGKDFCKYIVLTGCYTLVHIVYGIA